MEFIRNDKGELEDFEDGKSLGIVETTDSNTNSELGIRPKQEEPDYSEFYNL